MRRQDLPSLYLHDGAVASLDEMFDPARMDESHTPGGWLMPGQKTQAIPGHEFGLRLPPLEREQLIAFLKTLSSLSCDRHPTDSFFSSSYSICRLTRARPNRVGGSGRTAKPNGFG